MTVKIEPIPSHFYHYTSIESDKRKGWLNDILVDSKIYFRSREQLNDPEEMRPKIRFDGTDKELRDHVKKMFRRHSPIRLKPRDFFREVAKYMHSLKHRPESTEMVLHMVLDKIGILSLSSSPTVRPLWAHYADSFRGVCIEFDAEQGPFAVAQQVVYTNEPPIIQRLRDSMSDLLKKSMLTKQMEWGYEREWRVIARWDDAERKRIYIDEHDIPATALSFIQNQDGPGLYEFPRESIASVILGSEISADNEAEVRDMIGRMPKPVVVKRAHYNAERELEIVEV